MENTIYTVYYPRIKGGVYANLQKSFSSEDKAYTFAKRAVMAYARWGIERNIFKDMRIEDVKVHRIEKENNIFVCEALHENGFACGYVTIKEEELDNMEL